MKESRHGLNVAWRDDFLFFQAVHEHLHLNGELKESKRHQLSQIFNNKNLEDFHGNGLQQEYLSKKNHIVFKYWGRQM